MGFRPALKLIYLATTETDTFSGFIDLMVTFSFEVNSDCYIRYGIKVNQIEAMALYKPKQQDVAYRHSHRHYYLYHEFKGVTLSGPLPFSQP